MKSVSEAEIGTMYINAREAVPTRKTPIEMGYPQPRTLIQTNSLDAHFVVTNNVQPRRTKEMDISLCRLLCRDLQGQFRYYWMPLTMNLADYWTKNHPASHHQNMRPVFLKKVCHIEYLRRINGW